MWGVLPLGTANIFSKIGLKKTSRDVGKIVKKSTGKQTSAQSAVDLFPKAVPSHANQAGRQLVLEFKGIQEPVLYKITFKANRASKAEFRQRGLEDDKARSFKKSSVAEVLPMFILDYLCTRWESPPKGFYIEGGNGSPAATFGNALAKKNGSWYRLFVEFLPEGGKIYLVDRLFKGDNWTGRQPGPRRVEVNPEEIPIDCIEIFWDDEELTSLVQIQKLADQFRKTNNLPPPPKLDLPKGEGSAPPPQPPQQERPSQDDGVSSDDAPADETNPDPQTEFDQNEGLSSSPPPPPIDRRLFEITNPHGHTWDDSEGLLNLGDPENQADVWRIRDACEGVLIFGAVGSGKTSSSGAAIARAYLQAGFGGLVLTAKPDEAKRWLRMCQETGRGGDCVHVTPESGHKLNILQYESQRPGERVAVTDDLINLFRCILDCISRKKGGKVSNDEFWTNSTDQLMRKLFELFLLAGEPLALDRCVRFMNLAPQDNKTDWKGIKLFAEVIHRAKANADNGSSADKRIFSEVFDYWTKDLPRMTAATRSGIIIGFSAMADSLSGRGIYEMVNTETNLTPEMILSGKIVILDIPLKGNIQGGRMVQAIWKLLFQQAAERRSDKGKPTARPAFLWEDEGHLFFSQNDVDFQTTARDIRAPHVIMSQNIHNFLQEGHDSHAMHSVFSAMNTYIFHCNGDLDTNRWASERIGEEKKLKLTTDGLLRPLGHKDISFFDRPPEEVKNVGKFSLSEQSKSSLRPEDFAKLKRGGDGTCEAVILWLSHQFATNQGKSFSVRTFEQESRPT